MLCRPRPIVRSLATLLLLLAGSFTGTPAQESPPFQLQVAHSPRGMVTAGQPLATWAGIKMLEAGGNAADAAVAAAFAIAVVEPTMNGIGGRNQILIRLPNGEVRGIDGTTQVPSSYDPQTAEEATYGYAVIGVPGAVAGLIRLQSEFGTLPLETVMAPAIRYAREGFRVNRLEAGHFASRVDQASEFQGTRMHYLKPDGSPYGEGELMVNEALAATMEAIALTNGEAFYRGEIAERMVEDIQANGGVVTRESLEEYRAEDAFIVRGTYRGYEIVGSHNPSAGSLAILALHILENFDLAAMSPAERAARVGLALGMAAEDWDFYGTPATAVRLTSKEWASRRASELEARLQASQLEARLRAPEPEAAPQALDLEARLQASQLGPRWGLWRWISRPGVRRPTRVIAIPPTFRWRTPRAWWWRSPKPLVPPGGPGWPPQGWASSMPPRLGAIWGTQSRGSAPAPISVLSWSSTPMSPSSSWGPPEEP
jgi:gamma-glutamyltranspeptidase